VPVLPRPGIPQHPRPRYPSDMTDTERAVCEPALPAPAWLAGRGAPPGINLLMSPASPFLCGNQGSTAELGRHHEEPQHD
jgi:hypothetical protein